MLFTGFPPFAARGQVIPPAELGMREGKLRIELDGLPQQLVCGGVLGRLRRDHRVGVELQRVERRGGDARQRLGLIRHRRHGFAEVAADACRELAQRREDAVFARGRDRLGQDGFARLRADEPRRQRVGVAELRDVAGQETSHVLAFRHLGGERLVETGRRRAPHPLEGGGHAIARIHVDVLGLRDRDLQRDPKRSVEHGVARHVVEVGDDDPVALLEGQRPFGA